MQLSYNGYTHPENEANCGIIRQGLIAEDGFVWGYTERWSITGILHGDTSAELNAAMADLEAAYAVQGGNLTWVKGGTTMHALISLSTLSGTRVVTPPQFTANGDGELTTFRSYTIVVEADVALSGMTYTAADGAFPVSNVDIILLKYEESFDYKGTGGPRFGLLPTLKGTFQRQQLTETSPVEVTQTGMAIGLGKRPLPATPVYPDDEHLERRIIRKPQARKRGGYQIEYPIHWSYTFERNSPFTS
ncbi:hypothetical protein [Gimesia sp.]|uniref:hypothetical protein n=1 Tax=Gimesia sp. TaxID=2024833 RepID=UPI003A8D50A0